MFNVAYKYKSLLVCIDVCIEVAVVVCGIVEYNDEA